MERLLHSIKGSMPTQKLTHINRETGKTSESYMYLSLKTNQETEM